MTRLSLSAVLACGLFVSETPAALAQQAPALGAQFYSIIPAPPKLDAGSLGDITVWRDDMKNAKVAWRKGQYGVARGHLELALKKGNIAAAWYLGHIYRLGRGVKANSEKAFHYYRQAALAYDADEPNRQLLMITVDSLVKVANVYRDGIKGGRVERDPRRAFNLYNVAAGHGHPAAYYGLGVMYLKGLGIKRRPTRAKWWLKKAAHRRYAPAQALLGDIGWKASGSRGRIRGLMWYLLAQQTTDPADHPEIFDRLDKMLGTISEEERAKAEQLAAKFAQKYPVRPPVIAVAQ